MNRRNILYVIAAVILVGIVAAIVYVATRPLPSTDTNTGTDTQQPQVTSFDQTGNLIRNNPGLKPDVWYVSYEATGSPAVAQELAFSANSRCYMGSDTTTSVTCDTKTFTQGERARVVGTKSGSVVTVARLTLTERAAGDTDNDDDTGATTDSRIRVTSPAVNTRVTSPLTVRGEARGTWYFEASFPIKLLDANGKVLGQTTGRAQGDWMTENFVPFTATLTFTAPTTATGTLVLERDNPSGLPANAAEIRIPVRFSAGN